MWELQPLSNNRRTTKNLSITRRKHLTYSLTNTSQFCRITFPLSLFSSSLVSLLWCVFNAWMHCLFIGKHPCKYKGQGKWHKFGAYNLWLRKDGFTTIVDSHHCWLRWLVSHWLVSHSPTWRLWCLNQVFTLHHLWFFYHFNTCHLHAAYILTPTIVDLGGWFHIGWFHSTNASVSLRRNGGITVLLLRDWSTWPLEDNGQLRRRSWETWSKTVLVSCWIGRWSGEGDE